MEAVVGVAEGIGAGNDLEFVISDGRLSNPRVRSALDQPLALVAVLILLTGGRWRPWNGVVLGTRAMNWTWMGNGPKPRLQSGASLIY